MNRPGSPASHSIYGSAQEQTPRKAIGLALSLFVHGLLVWFIFFHQFDPVAPLFKKGEPSAITYIMAADTSAPAPKAKPKAAEAPPKAQPKKREKEKLTPPPEVTPPVVAVQPPPPPPPPQPEAVRAPEMDMAAMIEANRRRRAEARREQGEAEESENDRALRIARANIAQTGRRGLNDRDAGGVFDIRSKGALRGEFYFNGWSSERGRNRAMLVEVDARPGEDLEVTMVRRMIELIRIEKPGDFVWASRRLGRDFTLSARPQDEEELIRFLLAEMFPAYSYNPRRR